MDKNPVTICTVISEKFAQITQNVKMDNPNNGLLTEAYNNGVNTLYGAFSQWLNAYALSLAFTKEKGE